MDNDEMTSLDSNVSTGGKMISTQNALPNGEGGSSATGDIAAAVHLKRFPFMKLPTELRLRVYSFLFKGLELNETIYRGCYSKLRVPGILGVCREIRNEALDILYENVTIVASIDEEGICMCNKDHIFAQDYLAREWGPELAIEYLDFYAYNHCRSFVGQLNLDFRKIKRLIVTIFDVTRYDWDEAEDLTDYESETLKGRADGPGGTLDYMQYIEFIERKVNKAYDTRQTVQNFVSCLRRYTHVKHITVRLSQCNEDDTTWILEPFGALRNLKDAHFDVGAEHMCEVAELVTMMKGDSVIPTFPGAEKLESDFAALEDFISQFNEYQQGSWIAEARKLLFQARVACSDLEPAEFEEYRQAVLDVWERELKRRKTEEASAAAKIADLKR